MAKKVCAVVLLICTIVVFSGISAFAAEAKGNAGDAVTWQYDKTEKTLRFQGNGAIKNYAENEVSPWKEYMAETEKIIIDEGVTAIGNYAFAMGEKVKEISLPQSLGSIGDGAFGWCSALTDVKLPKDLKTIGDSAFVWCDNLKSVMLPENVEKIAGNAFSWSSKLVEFVVAEGNENYTAQNGILYSKDMSSLVAYPSGLSQTGFLVPEMVKTIGDSAFIGNNTLQEINLGAGTETIAEKAFFNCKTLKSVSFGPAVKSIDDHAFYGCAALTKVVLPEGLQKIGESAFKRCRALADIFIPDSVTQIAEDALTETKAEISGYIHSAAQEYAIAQKLVFREIVRVLYQGTALEFDEMPFIQEGRTLVPMRKIFETLGAVVTWEDATQTVTAVKGDTVLTITIGDNVLYKNGVGTALEVPAQLVGERTFVPLRAVSEAFDANVGWDEASSTVTITL